jgi:hypothetical protein
MAQIPKKTVRKLVTLPVELAEEVDRFREVTGASSESDALKVLIGWGLTRSDKPVDLFERCKRATASGLALGDVITSVVADHPLVENATVSGSTLDVYLKSGDLDSEHQLRFRFRRGDKTWTAERTEDHGRSWQSVVFKTSKEIAAAAQAPTIGGGRPATRPKGGDLDDDIPF